LIPSRKTLDNNDLNQVESAVFPTKMPLKHIKMAAQVSGATTCFLSTIDSVFSLENVLKNVLKNVNRVSHQEEYFCNKISSFYCANTCLLSCFGNSHCSLSDALIIS